MIRVNLRVPLAAACALLLLAATPVFAELYRWTDEDGTVHFAEQPPTTGQSDVETITDLPPARFRPDTSGGLIRCGRLTMSWPNGPVDRYVLTLARMIETQQRALAEGDGKDTADMRRCLIGWMQGQLKKSQATLLLMRDEYLQLMTDLQRLAEEKQACPNPAGGWLVGEEARAWMDCHAPRDEAIARKSDRARDLRILKPFWESLEPTE